MIKTIKGRIVLLLFLFLVWILLAGSLDIQELIIGGAVSFLIMIIPLPGKDFFSDLRLNPKALLYLIIYLFVFLYYLIKSNLDVAFRVLHPKLPINPGIVTIRTRLKSRTGRIALANSITLTPGTITVETKGDEFYIHWINIPEDENRTSSIEETTKQISENFEKYLEVIFG